jgi:serine/threonine protein kinase
MNAQGTCDSGSAVGISLEQTGQIVHILESYLNELERGGRPSREAFLAEHPELGPVLAGYLEKLELLHRAASALHDSPPESPAAFPSFAPERGRLGDYQLVREIGRGGMGIVYEAEQISLGRRVALKVMPFAPTLGEKHLLRFQNEARAAAHLHHAHIVPVHAVGCDRGVHYYAMQLIDGRSLAAVIAEMRELAGLQEGADRDAEPGAQPGETVVDARRRAETLPVDWHSGLRVPRSPFFKTVAQIGVQAAEALEHAHALGVVHRDIKPANLLLDGQAHLWITDFGLARCQGEGSLTITGALLGTLRYMSPEQALARRACVDERTDIYSLGVTLYELLTLEPANPGHDRQELLHQIAYEEPRAPRAINPAIPVELETIVLKAMAKEPEGRYGRAQDLADDLRCFLENRPIRARRPSVRDRLCKWARRHKPLVTSGVCLLVLATLGLVATTVLIWREQERTKAALAKAEACWHRTQLKEEEALAQRERAEKNFRKAYHGVTQLLLKLEERRWAQRPEFTELRRELAEQGVEFLQSFLDDTSTDPSVRLETGRAYVVLATVYTLQKHEERARDAYAKSIALFQKLVAERPRHAPYRHELALSHNLLGIAWHESGHAAKSRVELERAVAEYREAIRLKGESCSTNDLAWLLATCPDKKMRNPTEAVALAKEALKQNPRCWGVWNTLGVALYRAGSWKAAVEALMKSMELSGGGHSTDWFFLAMAYWKLGDKERAHAWCDRALERIQKALPLEPLSRYREEAEALLERVPARRTNG